MFLRFSALLIFFLVPLLFSSSVFAYSNEGIDHINPQITLRLAEKQGLIISAHERAIKKGLLKQKRAHPEQFRKELNSGIENSDVFQGYLLEVESGLSQVEKAKQIAKYRLYTQVEKNWADLKLTVLNINNDKTFKKFRVTLLRELNGHLNFRPSKDDKNFHFEIALWGTVMVTPDLKNITWKIEFAHKYDNNKLQKGVDKIQIQEDDSAPAATGGDDDNSITPPVQSPNSNLQNNNGNDDDNGSDQMPDDDGGGYR